VCCGRAVLSCDSWRVCVGFIEGRQGWAIRISSTKLDTSLSQCVNWEQHHWQLMWAETRFKKRAAARLCSSCRLCSVRWLGLLVAIDSCSQPVAGLHTQVLATSARWLGLWRHKECRDCTVHALELLMCQCVVLRLFYACHCCCTSHCLLYIKGIMFKNSCKYAASGLPISYAPSPPSASRYRFSFQFKDTQKLSHMQIIKFNLMIRQRSGLMTVQRS
jgi:hypothetical protein